MTRDRLANGGAMMLKAHLPSANKLGMVCLSLWVPLLVASCVHAQNRPFPYSLGVQDLVILPASVGLWEWGSALRDGYEPISRTELAGLSSNDVNWFDRSAASNWSYNWDNRSDEYRDMVVRAALLLTGAEAAYSLFQGELTGPFVLATMFGELYLCTVGATYMAKGLTGRKRPYAYNTSLSVDERYALATSDDNDVFFSFFSGHTAAAFAAATFTSKVFMDIHGRSTLSYVIWGSTLSVAAATGYARVKAGVHFPSDVIAGALAGGAIGYLVPALHKQGADDRLSLNVTPTRWSVSFSF